MISIEILSFEVQEDNQLKVHYNDLSAHGFQLKSFLLRFKRAIN